MASGGEVRYRVVLDGVKQATSEFDKFSATLLKGVSIWGAYKVAMGALEAQSESEAAINKLNLALANQGKFTEATSKSLLAYAAALQQASTFQDDAIVSAMAMASSFGMNEEQIKRTAQAAADFSAATGKDLESSMQMLGKAFVGNTTALQKMGFEFDKGATDAEKFESAVAQIEKRFGGSAQAATKTFAGTIAQLKNDFNDAQEGLGFFLGELLRTEDATGRARSALQGLADFFKTDMVVALSEFRALYLETIADIVSSPAGKIGTEAIAGFRSGGILGAFIGGQGAASGNDTFAQALRDQATALRAQGDAAAKAGANTQTFANAVRSAGVAVQGTTAAVKAITPAYLDYPLAETDIGDLKPMAPFLQNRFKSDLIDNFKVPAFSNQIGEATKKTFDWQKGLMGVLQIVGSISATLGGGGVGAALGSSIGATIGSFLPIPIPGLGTLAGGLLGGLFGGLFGGGPSKEEIAAEREKKEEETRAELRRISGLARQSRQQGVEGILESGPGFFASRSILTAEDAKRQGTIFAAAWGAVVKDKGIVAAADAFGETFKKMSEDMTAAGIDIPEWMQEIGTLVELGLDDEFRNIAEQANTAAKFLKALGDSGVLGPELISAFEEEARRAFGGGRDRALELGATEEEAIKAGFGAANPLLKELLNQSILQRTALSGDIQDMIDEAGIVPDVEFQQLDELRAIRQAVQNLAGIGGAGGGGGGGGASPDPDALPGEPGGGGPIIPKPGGNPGGNPFTSGQSSGGFGGESSGFGGGGITIPVTLAVDGREWGRTTARLIDRGTARGLDTAIARSVKRTTRRP